MNPVEQTRLTESTASNTFRLTSAPPLFTKGEGPFLFTESGRRYVDLACGSATTSLGHGHPAHRAAIEDVLQSGILHTGTRLPSTARAALYMALKKHLPSHLTAIHLANSGAEAVETALKAAMQATDRKHFIAFEGGYHGRTLGALALTHSEPLRTPFEPWATPWVSFAPYAATDAEASRALVVLNALLAERPCAAVIVEAVQGVAGVRGPSPIFLKGVADLVRSHNALLIVDEIWSGLGRSGRWFAFNFADLVPDLVVLGKGLSASLPLSAVAGRPEILQTWLPGTHTSTFQGNPVACAAAVATLEILEREDLVTRSDQILGPMVRDTFKDRTGLRVVGAQSALDLGSVESLVATQKRALDMGLLLYGSGESLMLLPPLNIPEAVFADALARLKPLLPTEP
ncbi:MAG: aspartate aminotransferase family protein [Pseudomonadota bacterium]